MTELVSCICTVCGTGGQMSNEQFVSSNAPILCRGCATGSGPLYVLTKKGLEKEKRLLKNQIKAAISDKGPLLAPDKIREYVPMPQKMLKRLLNEMARDGEVGANGEGAYRAW